MQKVSFIFTLSLLLSLTSCGLFGGFKKIVEIIEANGANHPNSDYLINNIQSNVLNIAQTVPMSKIAQIGVLGVPGYAVERFKAAQFTKEVVVNSFHFEISENEGKLIEGIGIIEVQGDKAKFAYAESTNTGNLITQQVIVKYKDCRKYFGIKRCKNRERTENRGFRIDELEKIKVALREKSARALTDRINVIKQMFNLH